MPRVFNLYVVAPERLPRNGSDEERAGAVRRFGARWAQVESKASTFLGACDEIGRLLGSPLVRGAIGALAPADVVALHEVLASAPNDVIDRIDAESTLASAYWALRETAEEAARRGASIVIECDG